MKKILVEKRGQRKSRINYYPFGLTFNSTANSPKNNYLYNQGTGEVTFKTERQPELGIDLTKYRAYDPALGRWWQIDPRTDELVEVSPYNYSFNNPIRYNDPEGDCPPWVCGAIAGAGIEYGVQVVSNFMEGQGVADAMFNNVDFADVTLAGVEGGLTGGTSVIKRIAVSAGTEILKSSIDIKGDGDKNILFTEGSDKTISSVATEASINVAIGESSNLVGRGASEVVNSQAKSQLKQVGNRIQRTASGSKNNIAAKQSKSMLESTISGNEKTLNLTIGKTSGAALKETKDDIVEDVKNNNE